MMIILHTILKTIQEADAPISLAQLADQLDIEPGALEGMIDFWVRKGRIRVHDGQACASSCGSCGVDGCPLILHMPRQFEVVDQP
jgi:hypothetical protein